MLAVFLGIVGCGPSIPAGYYDNPPAHTNVIAGGGTTNVTIIGTLSDAAVKPSIRAAVGPRANIAGSLQSFASGTLQVIDATGNVIGTGTVSASGTYNVSVPRGSNYCLRYQSGNLVLKAFVPSVTGNTSVPVNTNTTAQVMALAQTVGAAIGEPGVSAASALSAVNVATVVRQIASNPAVATLADALSTEIYSGGYNPYATTPTLGAASTSVSVLTAVTVVAGVSTGTGTGGGATGPVSQDSTPPQFKGVVLNYSSSIGTLSLHWPEAVDNVTSAANMKYNVYVGSSSSPASVAQSSNLKVTLVNKTTVTVDNLTPGSTYYCLVKAMDQAGNQSPNTEVSAATVQAVGLVATSQPKALDGMRVSVKQTDASNAVISGSDAAKVQTGDVIISDNPYGQSLKKVVSAKSSGGSTAVTLADTSLSEVVQSGVMEGKVSLASLKDIAAQKVTNARSPSLMDLKYKDPAGFFEITEYGLPTSPVGKALRKLVNYDTSASLTQDVTLGYSVSFAPELNTAASFQSGRLYDSLDNIRISAKGILSFDALASYALSGAASYDVTHRILNRGITLKYAIGAVPVVQEVYLEVMAHLVLNAKASLNMDAEISASKEIEIGFEWSSVNGWRQITSNTFDQQVTYNVVSGGQIVGTLEIYPIISTRFYKAAKSSLYIVPTLNLNSDARLLPLPAEISTFDTVFLVDSYVTASLKVWRITLADWTSPHYEIYNRMIFSQPSVQFINAPTTGNAGADIQLDLQVADGVNNVVPSTNIQYSASPSANITLTPINGNKSVKVNASAGGTYKITASAYGDGFLGAAGKKYAFADLAITGSQITSAPSAPTGVGAAAGNGQATVSWAAVSGATSYNVYYRTTTGVTTVNGTKVTGATSGGAITGLANGTTYYFKVSAVNAGGESALSSEVAATPQVAAAGAPTGVSASAGDGQATVSWAAVSGAASYNVYYGTMAGVTTSNGSKVMGATSGGAITGLANGTAYYFIVTAVNGGGESAASSEASATPQAIIYAPSAPTGVGVSAGDGQVAVSWSAVAGATSYNVYYRTTAGVNTVNGTKVTGATSSGATTGLANGTVYYFRVTAVNAGGESALSSEVPATPQVAAAGAPTGVSASAGDGQVVVSWTAVSGAASYNVYYRTTTGVTTGNGTKVTGHTSGAAITSLTNGQIYYFVVTAVNAGGESAASSEVSATPVVLVVRKVPDTGQTTCYDSAGAIIACAGTGQDGAYTINPPSYTDNGNGTITDNVTTLMWQKQSDVWTRDWTTAGTYCSTLALGGYNDWRLPSNKELISIVNYGVVAPSINATYFPGTLLSYWSSTTYAFNTSIAWIVSFTSGGGGFDSKTNSNSTRCVRGQQTVPSFNDNGDGTITDNVTGMMWQKQDDTTAKTLDASITYCEGLTLAGFSDWRLPNYKELSSIVDDTVYRPSINAVYFPSTLSGMYWSSTAYTGSITITTGWPVSFDNGCIFCSWGIGSAGARCVRLGP